MNSEWYKTRPMNVSSQPRDSDPSISERPRRGALAEHNCPGGVLVLYVRGRGGVGSNFLRGSGVRRVLTGGRRQGGRRQEDKYSDNDVGDDGEGGCGDEQEGTRERRHHADSVGHIQVPEVRHDDHLLD